MSTIVKAPSSHTLGMIAYRRAQREAAAAEVAVPIPPVLIPATPFDPAEPWCPQGPRTVYNRARALGLWVRATRACGPWLDADGGVTYPKTYSISVAVQEPRPGGRRMVLSWRFHNGKWQTEGALAPWVMLIEGREIHMPWAHMTSTDAQEVMKSWTTSS